MSSAAGTERIRVFQLLREPTGARKALENTATRTGAAAPAIRCRCFMASGDPVWNAVLVMEAIRRSGSKEAAMKELTPVP